MNKVLLGNEIDVPLYNTFIDIFTYTSESIKYFTGSIHLHKMIPGEKIHVKLTINGKPHLYIEYVDAQVMTLVYINPIPVIPGDVLKVQMRSLASDKTSLISYTFYEHW